jgi:hypothetical protein
MEKGERLLNQEIKTAWTLADLFYASRNLERGDVRWSLLTLHTCRTIGPTHETIARHPFSKDSGLPFAAENVRPRSLSIICLFVYALTQFS